MKRNLYPLAFVLSLFLPIVPVAGAEEPTTTFVEYDELVGERTAFLKAFVNDAGREVVQVGPGPLHYQVPGGGDWLEIDTTLVWDEGWRNDANSFPTHLPTYLGSGETIRLGPDLGLGWVPGTLGVRLTSGAILELAEPIPTAGYQPDPEKDLVLYPDLYPGIDLEVRVLPGTVSIEAVIRSWPFEILEEEIDRLFVDAAVEAPPELLEAVEERLNQGEPVEAVPVYFGRSSDELVIAVTRDPGFGEDALEDAANVLVPREGQEPDDDERVLASAFISPLGDWIATGTFRYWMQKPNLTTLFEDESPLASGMAAFQVVSKKTLLTRQRFGSAPGKSKISTASTTQECTFGRYGRCQMTTHGNRIAAGMKPEGWYRASMAFPGVSAIKSYWTSKNKSIRSASLGYNWTTGTIPAKVKVWGPEYAVVTERVARDPNATGGLPAGFTDSVNAQNERNVTAGTRSVYQASWAHDITVRLLGSNLDTFYFGPLDTKVQAAYIPPGRKPWDFAIEQIFHYLDGDTTQPYRLPLKNPYDYALCKPCVQNLTSTNPAVATLNDKLLVGVELTDVRLEVELSETLVPNTAEVSLVTPGSGTPKLYPGGHVDFTLNLDSLSGPATALRLFEPRLDPKSGLSADYFRGSQMATGVPELTLSNDTITLRISWDRAQASLYGKTQKLPAASFNFNAEPRFGTVTQTGVPGSQGSIQVELKTQAPEATVSVVPFTGTVPVSTSETVATLSGFSVSSLKAAQFAELKLEALPASPMNVLQQGTHWWSDRETSGSGSLLIYPDKMRPGLYQVKVTPCLKPAGGPADLHCLSSQAVTGSLQVTKAAGPAGPIEIDWLEPWSVDSPSAARSLKIHGSELGGTSSTVTVGSPLSTSGAVSGNAAQLTVPLAAVSASACGPVAVTVARTDGKSAAKTLNVVRPFRNQAPHVVLEGETADFDPKLMSRVTETGASNGSVATKNPATPKDRGRLVYTFRVPAQGSAWQIYLHAAPSVNDTRHFTRVIVKDSAGQEKANFIWADRLPGGYALRNLYPRGKTPGSAKLNLLPNETYTLTLSNEAAAGPFPKVDMVVLSAGTLPPLASEICR